MIGFGKPCPCSSVSSCKATLHLFWWLLHFVFCFHLDTVANFQKQSDTVSCSNLRSQPEILAFSFSLRQTGNCHRATENMKRLLNDFPCSVSAQTYNKAGPAYQHTLDVSCKLVHSVIPWSTYSTVSISFAESRGFWLCYRCEASYMDLEEVPCWRMNAFCKSAAESWAKLPCGRKEV